MDSYTRQQPLPSLAAAFAEVKHAGGKLVEAYVSEGTKEVMGATGRVVLAKFSAIALSAFAIGLSLYGLIFEAVNLGFTRFWLGSTPEMTKMASHATVVVLFALIALVLTRKKKDV